MALLSGLPSDNAFYANYSFQDAFVAKQPFLVLSSSLSFCTSSLSMAAANCSLIFFHECLLGLPINSSRSGTFSRLRITCQPHPWISRGRRQTLYTSRRRNLRQFILNTSAYQEDSDALPGAEHAVDRSAVPEEKRDLDKVLAVGEGVCIVASATACTTALIHIRSQETHIVVSTSDTPSTKFNSLPMWQILPLLAALIINAILRARQWQGISHRKMEKSIGNSVALNQRVDKLEEDVGSAVTIVRMLSRQLEKLGVRFRVTRQTLRDPIQETALLAQKTSESVSALAAREDMLEKELEEIQRALLAMQENQVKQLELVAALGKVLRERKSGRSDPWNATASKALKQKGNIKSAATDGALHNGFIHRQGGFWQKNNGNLQKTPPRKETTVRTEGHSSQGPTSGEDSGHPSSAAREQSDNNENDKQQFYSKVDNWAPNTVLKSDPWESKSAGQGDCAESGKQLKHSMANSTRGIGQFFSNRKSTYMNPGSSKTDHLRHDASKGLGTKRVDDSNPSMKQLDSHTSPPCEQSSEIFDD